MVPYGTQRGNIIADGSNCRENPKAKANALDTACEHCHLGRRRWRCRSRALDRQAFRPTRCGYAGTPCKSSRDRSASGGPKKKLEQGLLFEILYPRVAQIDCEDCQKVSYNLRSGRRNTYEAQDGEQLPVLRTGPPPCESCPKRSPQRAKQLKLREENRLMIDFYQRHRASKHSGSRLLGCPITQRNIRLIDQTLEIAKSKLATRATRRAKRRAARG